MHGVRMTMDLPSITGIEKLRGGWNAKVVLSPLIHNPAIHQHITPSPSAKCIFLQIGRDLAFLAVHSESEDKSIGHPVND